MNISEENTKKTQKLEDKQSMLVAGDETRREVLPILSTMYETDAETPENSLIGFATRLTNVAHSFIEEREKAYLNDELETMVRGVDSNAIDAVCRLAAEARANLKLAMDIKNQKAKAMIDLVKVMRR